MKAAMYSNFQKPLELTTVNDPAADDNGVVLEVKCTGLCLSDWHGWMGHDPGISLPHIPGHEMAGVIVEVGRNVSKWQLGDRVTLPFVCGCGHCQYCLEDNSQVCDQQFQPGFTHWGSFAKYVAINYAENNLVALPDYVDFQSASILGCRFSTAFRALVDQGSAQPGQWVVTFGCGGVGLSCIMIAHAIGAQIIAVDLDPNRLAFAKKLGAEIAINGSSVNLREQIIEFTKGGAHLGIDAVGQIEIVKSSIKCLRKGGKHLQIGLFDPNENEVGIQMSPIVANELQIIGSHGIQASRYPAIMGMIQKGVINPGLLVAETITLEQSLLALPNLKVSDQVGITVINDFS
jgi:alcohol dehydrogenase